MSISNTHKAIPYSVAVAAPVLYGSSSTKSVKAINPVHSGKKNQQHTFEIKTKETSSTEFSLKSAPEELYEVHVSSFRGLNALGGSQFKFRNSLSYSSKPNSEYNHIDLKRHQNYFDQIIHFDRPNGSWVDVKA